MADKQLFDIIVSPFQKAQYVPVTATTDAPPQQIVTITTDPLEAGLYMVGYAFQVTYQGRDRPLYFKLSGTFDDAEFFSDAAGTNNQLHMNKYYAFPKPFAGGVATLTLEAYDPQAEAVIDFADVFLIRIG